MDAGKQWQRYRDWLYHHEGLEIFLDLARMPLEAKVVRRLEPKLAQAFEAMSALESGAIANPDEGRMVGHYWLRAPKRAPSPELRAAIASDVEQVQVFARDVHEGRIHLPDGEPFSDLLAIGIGGSALGPQLLADALTPAAAPLRAHFLDNTDPAGIDRVLAGLGDRLRRTLIVVTSKSGSTPETRNGMREVAHVCAQVGLDFTRQAVAITGEGSALDQQAAAEGWLARFRMYDWVGGRTSVTSTVGLLPAALLGIDVQALLAGAREMDDATRLAELQRNPAALLALAWHAAGRGRGEKAMVVLPYKDNLLLLSRYLQQLVMESLGKGQDLEGRSVEQGITVYGNKGSTDQHAFVQQLREGRADFFVTFIEVLEHRRGASLEVEPYVTTGDYLSGLLYGTRDALSDNARPSLTITIPQVDARRMGALIALYERTVGLYASLVGVNAYHQPGVEAGKKAAAARLALQREILSALREKAEPLGIEALAERLGAADRVEAVYQILRHLEANARGVALSGDRARPATLKVSAR